jgi:hypothetical protein
LLTGLNIRAVQFTSKAKPMLMDRTKKMFISHFYAYDLNLNLIFRVRYFDIQFGIFKNPRFFILAVTYIHIVCSLLYAKLLNSFSPLFPSQYLMACCFLALAILPMLGLANITVMQSCLTAATIFSGLNTVGVVKSTQLVWLDLFGIIL